jgi:hypothetical protein
MARGNAFHQLQEFLHPHVKHCVVQMVDRVQVEEDTTSADDSQAHIRSQAVRIQRGEQICQVTALTLSQERESTL